MSAARVAAAAPGTRFDLEPIVWPEDDPYRDQAVFRAGERFWWHARVAREISERREQQGHAAVCLDAIAGNIGMGVYDVAKYVRQMIGWGELVRADALWDHTPGEWVALTPAADEEQAEVCATPSSSKS